MAMKVLSFVLILFVLSIPLTFAGAEEYGYDGAHMAQIIPRQNMFICKFDYPVVVDNKCDVTRPVGAVGEWCQCNYNGDLVDGRTIPNPSYRWQQ